MVVRGRASRRGKWAVVGTSLPGHVCPVLVGVAPQTPQPAHQHPGKGGLGLRREGVGGGWGETGRGGLFKVLPAQRVKSAVNWSSRQGAVCVQKGWG